MCNDNTNCKCISDILKVINILQKKARCHNDCNNMCDRNFLGCDCFCECNTRPIQLVTCGKNGNDPLVMPANDDLTSPKFSSVFRVERVDDCCCTCRVLLPVTPDDPDDCESFIATDSFFTIDLKCVCAIRCLEDTFVECV